MLFVADVRLEEPEPVDAKALNEVGAAVGRAIVDHNDLEILERLREDAVQCPTDDIRPIEDRYNDAHPWLRGGSA
jgi:hypothetical protein